MNTPRPSASKTVETIKHDDEKRRNIPTAEYQSMLQKEEEKPKQLRYPRNSKLDPQEMYQIERDFKARVESEFDKMIDKQGGGR